MYLFETLLILLFANFLIATPLTPSVDKETQNASNHQHPVVTMNGSRNYHAHKQIFNFYVMQAVQPVSDQNQVVSTPIIPEPYHSSLSIPGMQLKEYDWFMSRRRTREALWSDRYQLYKPNLYKIRMSWNEARKYCIVQGGHLGLIASEADETRYRNLMIGDGVERAWLGVHDQFREGEWVTILDEGLYDDVNYVSWDKDAGEPSDVYHKENCMALGLYGMLDMNCKEREYFFCMVPNL